MNCEYPGFPVENRPLFTRMLDPEIDPVVKTVIISSYLIYIES